MAGRSMAQLFAVMGGLIAWAAQFTIIYGVTSIACERGYADVTWFGIGLVPSTVMAATLLAFAATAYLLYGAVQTRRHMGEGTHPTDRFLNDTALVVSGLSLITVLWHGLPALIVPACG
jgi:hypothetical protein